MAPSLVFVEVLTQFGMLPQLETKFELLLPLMKVYVTEPTVTVPLFAGAPLKVRVPVLTAPAVKVRVFPPLVIVTVLPEEANPVNVPVLDAALPVLAVSAVPFTDMDPVPLVEFTVPFLLAATGVAPVRFTPKTTKSSVQLGAALISKLNFAGNCPGATTAPPSPSVMLQSPCGLPGVDVPARLPPLFAEPTLRLALRDDELSSSSSFRLDWFAERLSDSKGTRRL